MAGICFFLLALLLPLVTPAQTSPQRPRIFGIASVTILSSDVPEARSFLQNASDPERSCNWCESVPSRTVELLSGQSIQLLELPNPHPQTLLQEITFRTDDLRRLAKFLKSNHVLFHEEKRSGEVPSISLSDPEGHNIAFTSAKEISEPLIEQVLANQRAAKPTKPFHLYPRIIHAGFVVHDRAAMDHFYKDILGFRVYWHGGMKDGETDWVDMQVPDGTDWIEYMLNVPDSADKRELGVMNHIALGVPDIHAAEQQLLKNGVKLTEKPQIGRDGKWQLNLYDPDGTRVELMEFTPVEKPCCSDYTGPHPKP
jgi:catechol 2,3-dioxygenase-like lactoylglutathione lyase family enzyme